MTEKRGKGEEREERKDGEKEKVKTRGKKSQRR